jgi:hypothetical protein
LSQFIIILLSALTPYLSWASSWEECHLLGRLEIKGEKAIFTFIKTTKADGMMNDLGNRQNCDRQFKSGFSFNKDLLPRLKSDEPITVIYNNYGAMGPEGFVSSTTYKFDDITIDSTQIKRLPAK